MVLRSAQALAKLNQAQGESRGFLEALDKIDLGWSETKGLSATIAMLSLKMGQGLIGDLTLLTLVLEAIATCKALNPGTCKETITRLH